MHKEFLLTMSVGRIIEVNEPGVSVNHSNNELEALCVCVYLCVCMCLCVLESYCLVRKRVSAVGLLIKRTTCLFR